MKKEPESKQQKLERFVNAFATKVNGKALSDIKELEKIIKNTLEEENIDLRKSDNRYKERYIPFNPELFKTGMKVRTKNGQMWLILVDPYVSKIQNDNIKILLINPGGWMPYKQKQLNDGYDVMEIYEPTSFYCELLQLDKVGKLIWKDGRYTK